MTITDIYEITRTDDMPTQVLDQRLGRHSHPYSEAAERITGRQAGEGRYVGKHVKEATDV